MRVRANGEAMRIGFVGTGAIARRHLMALRTLSGPIVIACHLATTGEKANAAVHEWGGVGFIDPEEFLQEGKPDAVFITVPPHQHGPIESILIERNIPFLVEKPLSADRKTAEAIAAGLRSRGLVTAVGYQWRALNLYPEFASCFASVAPTCSPRGISRARPRSRGGAGRPKAVAKSSSKPATLSISRVT